MSDQFPLLLVLSPLIGAVITLIAVKAEPGLVRSLAIFNVVCSVILLAGAGWQFQRERADEIAERQQLMKEEFDAGAGKNTFEIVQSRMEREYAERQGQRRLVVDGINLWPMLLLIVLIGAVFLQTKVHSNKQASFFPLVLAFESATLAALMSYDLRVFLMAAGASVITMAMMLGVWGGPDRRDLTIRFLVAQASGGAFVLFGFAMLVVAIPWMKIEDSRTIPPVLWNIASMTHEIRKWTSGNPLAFQYENETFPLIVLIISLGFAIQCGLFPFHNWLVALLSRVPGQIVAIFVAGSLTSGSVAWLRFVMPLTPDILTSSEPSAVFDWVILTAALGNAFWGASRALVSTNPRSRLAYLFLSLWGITLLGGFSFSRVALSGMWLMQQQLCATLCAAWVVLSPSGLFEKREEERFQASAAGSIYSPTFTPKAAAVTGDTGPSFRLLILMTCLSATGVFASATMIFMELLRSSLFLILCMLFVIGTILWTVDSLLKDVKRHGSQLEAGAASGDRLSFPAVTMLVLMFFVNFFPQRMMAPFEPDFVRVFQKYEAPQEVPGMPVDADDRQ